MLRPRSPFVPRTTSAQASEQLPFLKPLPPPHRLFHGPAQRTGSSGWGSSSSRSCSCRFYYGEAFGQNESDLFGRSYFLVCIPFLSHFDPFTQGRVGIKQEHHPLFRIHLAQILIGQPHEGVGERLVLACDLQRVFIRHMFAPARDGVIQRHRQQAVRAQNQSKGWKSRYISYAAEAKESDRPIHRQRGEIKADQRGNRSKSDQERDIAMDMVS